MEIPTYLSGALFMKAYRLLRANVTACLERYDFTPTSWVLIGIIKQAPDGIRLAEVAHNMNVKAPLVTALAQDLISRELAELVPHPTDRRVKLLLLTTNGKQLVKKVEASMEQSLGSLLKGVAPADLQGFKRVLETVVSNSTERLPSNNKN